MPIALDEEQVTARTGPGTAIELDGLSKVYGRGEAVSAVGCGAAHHGHRVD